MEHLGIISTTERSSAYLALIYHCLARLLTSTANSKGANLAPWGIPPLGTTWPEIALLILTDCDLFVKNGPQDRLFAKICK